MPAQLGVAFTEALAANIGEGVYAVDTRGRLTYLNDAGAGVLGWDRKSLQGRDVHDLVHGHRSDGTCPLHAVMQTDTVERCDEDTFVARGGRAVPVAWTAAPMRDPDGSVLGAVVVFRDVSDELAAADRLRQEARRNEVLVHFARQLAGEHEAGAIVQAVTDAGVLLTRAAFGAFFYDHVDDSGESNTQYTVSGVPLETFDRFPLPRKTPVFAPTFAGDGTVRFDDVTTESVYGSMEPHHGLPPGHLPVRSYLAVPVVGRTGTPIGGLFFGHPEPAVFNADDERLVEGIAAHAAVALDTARVMGREVEVAVTLQRSLLPREIPRIPGIAAATRYVTAEADTEVGGDWYDVILLPDGNVGAVIGDVAGHSVHAATVMGQIRNALRGYALEGHSPAGVMERVNRFLLAVEPGEMITCCYVELDQSMGTATVVSAGHPPLVLVVPGGASRTLEVDVGPPLGVDAEIGYVESTVLLPRSSCLVLYTDGLIERRELSLDVGISRLLHALDRAVTTDPELLDPEVLADAALAAPTVAVHADDTAVMVLAIRNADAARRDIVRRLPSDSASPGVARRFVTDVLEEWDMASLGDVARLLVSELVTNAVLHTVSEVELRLWAEGGLLRAEVSDGSAERPVRMELVDGDQTSGRGLQMVDAMSTGWGVDATDTGKTVWFELVQPRSEALAT